MQATNNLTFCSFLGSTSVGSHLLPVGRGCILLVQWSAEGDSCHSLVPLCCADQGKHTSHKFSSFLKFLHSLFLAKAIQEKYKTERNETCQRFQSKRQQPVDHCKIANPRKMGNNTLSLTSGHHLAILQQLELSCVRRAYAARSLQKVQTGHTESCCCSFCENTSSRAGPQPNEPGQCIHSFKKGLKETEANQMTPVCTNRFVIDWGTLVLQVCYSCMGRQDRDLPCKSLDCSVLFRITRAVRELRETPHLRTLRDKMLTF